MVKPGLHVKYLVWSYICGLLYVIGGAPASSGVPGSGISASRPGAGGALGSGVGHGLGVLPHPSAIPWVPLLSPVTHALSGITTTLAPAPPVVSPSVTVPGISQLAGPAAVAVVPAGAFMAEGLLPVPEKLAQKIFRLEFIEMREMMPEMWLQEEEASRNILSWPRRKAGPVTDILQWLQCYSAMVGVLARVYPQFVPEFMAYQATIIKCSRDFDGLAWAQYDRVYRRQVSQTRDLRWSRLNPTLYSLCFAGKAKRHVACNFCLSEIMCQTSARITQPGCSSLGSSLRLGWELLWCPPRSHHASATCSTRGTGRGALIGSVDLPIFVRCVGGHTLARRVKGGPTRVLKYQEGVGQPVVQLVISDAAWSNWRLDM